jgi:tetratricopeptide (TPR) repeat protein
MIKTLQVLMLTTLPLYATSMSLEFFEKANRLFEKGKHDSAVIYYEKIISMGMQDSRVYYNLGNAHFRKNDLGQAILNYALAKKLNPTDIEIEANLRFAKAATVDKIPPRKIGFFEKVLNRLHNMVGISAQAVLFLILIYIISIVFILRLMLHVRFRSTISTLGIIFLVVLVLLSASFFTKIYQENKIREAVVLADKVNAKNEPDGSQVLFSVHEGTTFRLNRKVGEWYFASLENGVSGWVHEDALGIIEVPQ